MKPKVYIETSIPSFYFEVRTEPEMVARREWTRLWWSQCRENYEVVSSEAVLVELAGGNFPSQSEALELVSQVPLLAIEEPIMEIVEAHIRRVNAILGIYCPSLVTPLELLESSE